MAQNLDKFVFWGKKPQSAPRLTSFQVFQEMIGQKKPNDGKRKGDVASFSCQSGCNCTP